VLTFAVVPCLNEEVLVSGTIESLLQPAEDGGQLVAVVVDNGSTDGTPKVLDELCARHPGLLHIVREERRGYVPARRAGVERVSQIVASLHAEPINVLILQADADTVYLPGYAAAMRRAAVDTQGVMLEGSIGRPPEFIAAHPAYVAAERMVDEAIEPLEASDEEDVVVDDKVCAYRLSDYLRWGGLFEEQTEGGDPVHAETTRLFIRARLTEGARKVRVNPAGARPSRRRAIENPRYHFATLGFPRERAWALRNVGIGHAADIDAFASDVLAGGEQEVVRLRAAHLLTLFRYLPALVARAQGRSGGPQDDDLAAALDAVPAHGREKLVTRPALAITDALGLIDSHPELFRQARAGLGARISPE
jgi:glycosyltransferase involved in cell wall biosynthesis